MGNLYEIINKMKQTNYIKKHNVAVSKEVRDFLIIERRRLAFVNVDAYLRWRLELK